MIITGRFPPLPEGFRKRFIEQGWRGVERVYGARREVIQRWIAEAGGPVQLTDARKAWLAEAKAQRVVQARRKGR
ncbi:MULTISPECIES: hypothetical protein [unclassified Novosphingobium]|uniref:hypothetical protein n=1 Tax=unclassified Novosphingobium TaxID=2644732 RepID=UPI0013581F7B|nr:MULTISPECIES: hypothetical protein [unclassified Novosphingobium]